MSIRPRSASSASQTAIPCVHRSIKSPIRSPSPSNTSTVTTTCAVPSPETCGPDGVILTTVRCLRPGVGSRPRRYRVDGAALGHGRRCGGLGFPSSCGACDRLGRAGNDLDRHRYLRAASYATSSALDATCRFAPPHLGAIRSPSGVRHGPGGLLGSRRERDVSSQCAQLAIATPTRIASKGRSGRPGTGSLGESAGCQTMRRGAASAASAIKTRTSSWPCSR